MKYLIIISFLFLTSCASLIPIPQLKMPLKDIEDIPIYNIYYDCTGTESDVIYVCKGGIKNGVFYCNGSKKFKCEKGNNKIFWAFDTDKSWTKLSSYLKYLIESYNDK